jgi:hypothetical protein
MHKEVDEMEPKDLYYLPKPGKNFIVQYCGIHHNRNSLMNKMEATVRQSQREKHQNQQSRKISQLMNLVVRNDFKFK